jgi:mono/diheme cytochrome c family protein
MTRSLEAGRRRAALGLALASALALASCAVEFQNREPARQLARETGPSGSVYVGWRVFEDRCARCHGVDAAGSALAPDLLARMREMGSRRFVNLVLRRYDWSLPAAESGGEEAARESLVEEILQRKESAFAMPAWQDEPGVDAHILDLYAYLSARADGVQGPGRPRR